LHATACFSRASSRVTRLVAVVVTVINLIFETVWVLERLEFGYPHLAPEINEFKIKWFEKEVLVALEYFFGPRGRERFVRQLQEMQRDLPSKQRWNDKDWQLMVETAVWFFELSYHVFKTPKQKGKRAAA